MTFSSRSSTGGHGNGTITEADADDLLDRSLGDDLRKRRGHPAEDDDDVDTGIVQLVLELARSVEWIHIYLGSARAHDPKHCDWKRWETSSISNTEP